MGGAGWMDRQAAGVAKVGDVCHQFEAIDELFTSFQPTPDTETDHCTGSMRKITQSGLVVRMTRQPWILDPNDLRMGYEELGYPLSVAHVALHTQAEGLQTLDE